MTLFENIYYDLLIEGKSPEEILSILKYKFKNVPEQVIDAIFEIDPTKKKSYTQWILLHYDNEKHVVDKAIQNGSFKRLFKFLQSHQETQLAKFKTIEEALYVVSDIDLLKKDSENELANDFDIVYKSPEWVIVVPNTYEAEHKIGENTDWCTAGYKFQNGRGYYDRYLKDYGGKYFVNFDFRGGSDYLEGVEYPFKRYQFHFESNQFMNAKDEPIDGQSIDIPDDVVRFYESEGYDIDKVMENDEEKFERYNQRRFDDGVNLSDDLWILREYNENYDFDENDGGYYHVYDIYLDDRDSFCGEYVTKQPLYMDEGNEIFILNSNTDDNESYDGNLTEFNDTQTCKPLIIFTDGSNWTYSDDIIYYKIMENNGNTFVVYIKKTQTGSSFCITSKVFNIEEPIPFDVNTGVSGVYINENMYDLYQSYESEFAVEIVWDNGFHSLYNVTSRLDATIVVGLDLPVDSDLFTVGENEDGEYIILGKLRNYNGFEFKHEKYISDEVNKKKPKQIIDKLFYNYNVIVQMIDGNYNVYNTQTKQIIFDDNFGKIVHSQFTSEKGVIIGYRFVNNNQVGAIYSLDTGKQLTPFMKIIEYFGKSNIEVFGAQNEVNENYLINPETFKVYGPYYGLTPYGYKNKIFVTVKKDEGNKVLNITTGEIEFENLTKCTHFNNKNNIPIMFALGNMGQCVMVNYYTGNILDSDVMISQKPKESNLLDNYVIIRHSSSGKENMVSMINGDKIFPNDVTKIGNNSQYNDYDDIHKTPKGYVAFKDNNTEYILHLTESGNELLPTSNGITTGETTGLFNYRLKYTSCISFLIHDSKESPAISVMYNFIQNNVFVEDESGVTKTLQTCEPEIQQRVMQAINPQRHQVVSQYNEMIERMKKILR